MAFNLRRALQLGRHAYRLYEQFSRSRPSSGAAAGPRPAPQRRAPAPGSGHGDDARLGAERTAAYPGDFTGAAALDYSPVPGPEAGPGEVVWTWVPYEELDGRGKDRPVLVIARDGAWLLAVQLTSRDRNNATRADADYVDVGAGAWDRSGRASEANVSRIVRVDPADVRRDGGLVDPATFGRVADAVRRSHSW